MKLSDYKGEKALDILADLVEPAAKIMADKEVVNCVRSGMPAVKLVKPILKNHKREVIEIMAALEEEEPETYAKKVNLLTLPKQLLDILNDQELVSLFTSHGQKTEEIYSTSATESTKANEQ